MTVDTWPILIDRLDGSDLVGWTGQFVADLREGFDVIDDETHPWTRGLSERSWAGVLSIGMGGSAAAGDLLATMMGSSGSVPVISIRGYDLPSWFDPETWLVLCTSYSGNTEETLSACRTALGAGAVVVAISTGGELAGLLCDGGTSTSDPPETRPTSTHRLRSDLLPSTCPDVVHRIAGATAEDRGRRHAPSFGGGIRPLCTPSRGPRGAGGLAEEVGDAPIAVLATSDLAALGQRFVNQLAEHSGRFARLEIVPEQNHNMLVAWGAIGTDGDASAFEHAVLIRNGRAPTHVHVRDFVGSLNTPQPTDVATHLRRGLPARGLPPWMHLDGPDRTGLRVAEGEGPREHHTDSCAQGASQRNRCLNPPWSPSS